MYFSLLSLVTECQELTHDQFGLKTFKLPTSEFDLNCSFFLLLVGFLFLFKRMHDVALDECGVNKCSYLQSECEINARLVSIS